MYHSQFGMDLDYLRLVCKGKLQWRKCPDCDINGMQYWDGSTGEGVSPTSSGIDPEFLAKGGCETCYGLGYHFFEI